MFVQMGLKGREKAGKERGQEGFWVAVVPENLSSVLIFNFCSLIMETKPTSLFINPESFSFIWKTDTNYYFSFILRILLENSICIFKSVTFTGLCLYCVSSKAFLMLPFNGVTNSWVSLHRPYLVSSILPTVLHLLLLFDSRRKFTEKNNKENQVF